MISTESSEGHFNVEDVSLAIVEVEVDTVGIEIVRSVVVVVDPSDLRLSVRFSCMIMVGDDNDDELEEFLFVAMAMYLIGCMECGFQV
jgi:hypothetical protein